MVLLEFKSLEWHQQFDEFIFDCVCIYVEVAAHLRTEDPIGIAVQLDLIKTALKRVY